METAAGRGVGATDQVLASLPPSHLNGEDLERFAGDSGAHTSAPTPSLSCVSFPVILGGRSGQRARRHSLPVCLDPGLYPGHTRSAKAGLPSRGSLPTEERKQNPSGKQAGAQGNRAYRHEGSALPPRCRRTSLGVILGPHLPWQSRAQVSALSDGTEFKPHLYHLDSLGTLKLIQLQALSGRDRGPGTGPHVIGLLGSLPPLPHWLEICSRTWGLLKAQLGLPSWAQPENEARPSPGLLLCAALEGMGKPCPSQPPTHTPAGCRWAVSLGPRWDSFRPLPGTDGSWALGKTQLCRQGLPDLLGLPPAGLQRMQV